MQISNCSVEGNEAPIGGALQFSQSGSRDYLLEIENSRLVGNSATINIVGFHHSSGNSQGLRIDRSVLLDNDGIVVRVVGESTSARRNPRCCSPTGPSCPDLRR